MKIIREIDETEEQPWCPKCVVPLWFENTVFSDTQNEKMKKWRECEHGIEVFLIRWNELHNDLMFGFYLAGKEYKDVNENPLSAILRRCC